MSNKLSDKLGARKRGATEFIIGVVAAAAGGLLTLISYNTAKAGQKYTIYTGLIALGAVYAILGMVHFIAPKAEDKNKVEESTSEKKEAKDEVVVEED